MTPWVGFKFGCAKNNLINNILVRARSVYRPNKFGLA